ncbi:hypothetical protein IAD21_01977 [Abditibacteriota bacterium]|nr:hypothetical protein IAD21_01977 [Abditibacteriota bacterium]
MADLPPLLRRIPPVIYWSVATTSFCWIPFAAGFISSYFWRHLQAGNYVNAIWVNTIAFWLSVFCVAAYFRANPCVGLIFFYLDVGMCSRGTKHGSKFWSSRLARQFLGDFSTRNDEESEPTNHR